MTAYKLPTFNYQGINYTVDARLREIRQTDKPYLSLRFDDIESEEMQELTAEAVNQGTTLIG